VTIVKRAGDSGSWPLATNQEAAKGQLSAVLDALRQLIGNANIASGNSESTDPLTAPFHLYVDFDRGSDIYVTGDYNSFEATGTEEEIIAQKLKRVRNQRMVAGYTKARPFKTLNRLVKEAEIITSLAWYTFTDERAHRDCVIIHMGSGPQPIYNHPGNHSSAVAITAWTDGKIPTWQELIKFNNDTIGSVLIPRGAAFHGEDLRKCVMVPMWAPPAADIASDYSNIRTVLSLTPDVHAVDFTFRDPIGQAESLHLLYGIGYASQAELTQSYAKTFTALGSSANLSAGLTTARLSEYQVVGPISGTPARAWDTVKSASAYPERISLRTQWGMGALFIDGRKLEGLRSTVTAQYTAVTQQTDLNSIQIYSDGAWITPANYQAYLDAQPNDTRTKPSRMHCQVLAVGPAFVSTVSMFGICPAVQVYADLGAEVTSSNGNLTFGDCAAIARGYKDAAFPQDKNWGVEHIKAPLNPSALPSAVSRTVLGTVSAVSSTTISLAVPLVVGASNNIPAALEAAGYSLSSGNYIWVENPTGDDWRALLTGSAWSASNPGVINITAALAEGNSGTAAVPVVNGSSQAIGQDVYIRRVVDSRDAAQRRASLRLINTAPTRVPLRGMVIQTTPAGTGISRALAPETTDNTGSEVLIVTRQDGTIGSVTSSAEITVRRGAASVNYAASAYYRKRQVVKAQNKHWQAKADFISADSTLDPALWGEIYKHMPEQYNPADIAENECPQIKFDIDTDPLDNSTACGINWGTVFTSAGSVRDQFRSGVDALGVHAFLRALGFSDATAWAALTPRTTEALRLLNPASATDFPTAPSGGAASGRANWSVEFRRATVVSLLGFTYDVGAGMGVTYSKALPQAQKTISPENLFSTYFTAQGGGRAIVRGTNEEGQEVTNRGLADAETGELTLAGDVGGSGNIKLPQKLENGSIIGTIDFGAVTDLTGGNAVGARASTTRFGFGILAPLLELLKTGSDAPVAGSDAAINNSPLVTIAGLNRWRQAQRLVSTATGSITIFVQGSAADRTLEQMLENPPTTTATAIPTLARAAEYANAIIGAGNQTAEIRIAPGLYDPASVWECNVVFRASDPTVADWPLIFPETITGNATTDNNYFDGSGYGNFTTRVNFRSFTLALRSASASGNNLQVNVIGRQLHCKRNCDFRGGFHFLGIPELIKAVADGELPAAQFLSGSVALPSGAYTTDVATNVNTFLNQLRISNSRNASYSAWTTTPALFLNGPSDALANIRGIVFGPVLPSRKEFGNITRDPYIGVRGGVALQFSNIYIRGTVSITSAGIGVTNAVPFSGSAHYGSSNVTEPWTWRQTHHTFLGSLGSESDSIYIDQLGADINYPLSGEDSTQTYFQNLVTYLPNHIHLQTAAGAVPGDDDTGPFFDQFIHAKTLLSVRQSFQAGFTGDDAGGATQGFFGRFGSNGYNTAKTRGVLLGNQGLLDQERSATVVLGSRTLQQGSDHEAAFVGTIFAIAGISKDTRNVSVPKYVIGSATFGEPNPPGAVDRKFNPVITSAGLNQADGVFGLNMGVRSYARGISPEHGFNVTPNAVL
jgi:hypothetical protein